MAKNERFFWGIKMEFEFVPNAKAIAEEIRLAKLQRIENALLTQIQPIQARQAMRRREKLEMLEQQKQQVLLFQQGVEEWRDNVGWSGSGDGDVDWSGSGDGDSGGWVDYLLGREKKKKCDR